MTKRAKHVIEGTGELKRSFCKHRFCICKMNASDKNSDKQLYNFFVQPGHTNWHRTEAGGA